MKHTLYGLLLVVLVTAGAPSAYADSSTKVFPLAGSKLPKSRQDMPEVLTKAVAKAVNGDIASVPIEDAVGWFACDIDTPECLEAVSKQVKAHRIVYGSVETHTGGGLSVTLTWFGEDGGQERKFTLIGDEEEMSQQLERQLETAMRTKPTKDKDRGKEPKDTEKGKDGGNDGTEVPVPVKLPKEPVESSGGITGGTWALIGTGAGLAAVGGGFAIWASSLSSDVRNAPTNTLADFDHLEALEKAGKLRARIGAGLLIAGGVVATVGVIRAVLQKQQPSQEQPLVDVRPENGGASVVLTLGFH